MAAALLLGSLARKMARAPPAHHHPLLARGLHGSGPGASSFSFQQGRGDQCVVGVDAAAGLPSLVARAPPPPPHHHGLHSLNNSTPPTSRFDFAKIRFGVAYVALFGSLAYLYGSLLPRLKRLEAKVEAQKQSKLDDASTDGPDTAQIMQSSAARAAREIGKTKHKDLEAKLTKLELTLEAARKERRD